MSSVTGSNDSFAMKVAAFASGVAIVLFLFLFGELIRQDGQIVTFFNNFNTLTFSAVGLILGLYIGDIYQATDTEDKSLKLLNIGAFLTAALILTFLHRGDTYQSLPFTPPIPIMILAAVGASSLLFVSPIPVQYDLIDDAARLVIYWGGRIYLVSILVLKYGFSLGLIIVNRTPYEGFQPLAIVYSLFLITIGVSTVIVWRFSDDVEGEPTNDSPYEP